MAEPATERICPRCGGAIPADAAGCPRCEGRWASFLNSRETVLGGSIFVVIALFFITGGVVRGYHEKLHDLAGQWFAAAETSLNAGNASAALSDLRNALVYEPEDLRIQFRLAQALMAAGHDEEARTYLEGLLAQAPSNAEVNLSLAQIAAKSGNETDALRYYHGAIYGVWPNAPEANRLSARFELCRFLVARNDDASADGELISLVSEIPAKNSSALHERAGELFLRAGDPNRALAEFRAALRAPKAPVATWKNAGIAAYELQYFAVAQRYLERSQRVGKEEKDDPEVKSYLETSRLVLQWDPYLPHLTEPQRNDRVRHNLAQAIARLESCAKASGLDLTAQPLPAGQNSNASQNGRPQGSAPVNSGALDLAVLYSQAQTLRPQLAEKNLRRHPEQIDAAMNLVFTIETAAAQKCGEPAGLDKALLEIQKTMQGGER